MDKVVAARMEKELAGARLGKWTLAECINYGKSALVFRATKGSTLAAVKVFDRDLVERFGKEAQRERVRREAQLVGKNHRHLIEILDAGEDTDLDVLYVAMAFFPGKNLKDALLSVPHARVFELMRQVAEAAEFLESLHLAHRDIKPENIGITDDFSSAVLLDLGVMRPIGFSTITDQEGQRSFMGTLQYSPPELLHREELDSVEGWRAVTFYQLGAVLHDLLVRKPIFFDDLTPYPHLVDTVSRSTVTIHAPGTPSELRMLAQDCLVKDPLVRLQLVTWERFKTPPGPLDDLQAVKERIALRRKSTAATMSIAPGLIEQDAIEELRIDIDRILRDACKQSDLPPFVIQGDDSRSTARARFVFGPSRVHSLNAAFAIYVEGAIIDASGGVIHCHTSVAITSDGSLLPAEAPAEHQSLLFQGVRANDVLAQRLGKVLLMALDQAQELCAQRRIVAEPMWLPIAHWIEAT